MGMLYLYLYLYVCMYVLLVVVVAAVLLYSNKATYAENIFKHVEMT